MGVGFSKLRKFAQILRLRFIHKANYYEHREDFIFPEVHPACKKKPQQVNEIQV